MLTYEHFIEYITKEQNETHKKHPELAMSKIATFDRLIEQAKREGAREFLNYIRNNLVENGGCVARWEIRFEYLEKWLQEMEGLK